MHGLRNIKLSVRVSGFWDNERYAPSETQKACFPIAHRLTNTPCPTEAIVVFIYFIFAKNLLLQYGFRMRFISKIRTLVVFVTVDLHAIHLTRWIGMFIIQINYLPNSKWHSGCLLRIDIGHTPANLLLLRCTVLPLCKSYIFHTSFENRKWG